MPMKIKIPDGFEIPPEVRPGGRFTVVAEFEDNKDGTITLKTIDDAEVDGEEEEEETEETVMPMQPDAPARAREAGYTMMTR